MADDIDAWIPMEKAAIYWFKDKLPKKDSKENGNPHSQSWIEGFNICLDEIHRRLEE